MLDFIEDHLPAIVAGFIALAVLGLLGFYVAWSNADNTVTCTVESKDRAAGSSGSSMRIYTKECGVLEVSDNLLRGKWDSADTYAKIDSGKKYEFDTIGWRIPLLSAFPDILDARPVG